MKSGCSTAVVAIALCGLLPVLSGCQKGDAVVQRGAAATALSRAAFNPSLIQLPSDAPSRDQIRYAVAQPELLAKVVTATGQLQPDASQVARISVPMRGKAVQVNAVVGDRVARGQTLLTLSSTDLTSLETQYFEEEADVDANLARDLVDIDCDLKQTEAQIKLLEKQHDRAQLLFQEKIGSLSALEQITTELQKQELTKQALQDKRARLQKAAQQKKALARRSVEQQLQLLGMPPHIVQHALTCRSSECTIPIETPQSGMILERSVNPGELNDVGKAVFLVDDLDSLWLVADIFEQDLDKVRVGQPIEFTVDSRPNKVYKGTINFVSGAIDPETRTLAVRATVPNPGLDLKPKMFARLKIDTGKVNALAIPKDCIQEVGSRKVVYVPVGEDQFEERTVEVGEQSGKKVEVLSGLKSGEKIVSNGSFMLRALSLKQSS